jgi:hypothetical protein
MLGLPGYEAVMSKTHEKWPVRRDPTGHLNPDYERELLEASGRHKTRDPFAFVNEPKTRDELAEALGEAAVLAMTAAAAGEGQLFEPAELEPPGTDPLQAALEPAEPDEELEPDEPPTPARKRSPRS